MTATSSARGCARKAGLWMKTTPRVEEVDGRQLPII
jgi:hypothetical protein